MTQHNYHIMPDGTPIPGEGLPCKCIGQHGEKMRADVYVCMPFSKEGIMRFFTSQGWVLDAEPIREPEHIPLTMDDYDGQAVRIKGEPRIYWPYEATRMGIFLFDNPSVQTWSMLSCYYEWKKDGVWQPMRKVKA